MRPREDWWDYTKKIIQSFPEIAKKRDIKCESLSECEQRRYDAVDAAIEQTANMVDGEKRVELIDCVYFKRSHTLYGAAMEVSASERTAKRWNRDFVQMVAEKLNLP